MDLAFAFECLLDLAKQRPLVGLDRQEGSLSSASSAVKIDELVCMASALN